MLDRLGLWPLRVVWAGLPVTAGAAVGDGLAVLAAPGTSTAAATVVTWVVWAGVLLATALPSPTTLTAVRLVVPATPVLVGWALAATTVDPLDVVGLVVALAAACVALLAATGDAFVDGASYGSERRMALRVPVPLLLGPVPGAWLVATAGLVVGPLLLVAGHVAWAALATTLGWATAALAVRALHQLSRRWLVFVPNGLVLVDPLTLASTVALPRRSITGIAAAGPPQRTRAPGEPAPTFGLRLAVHLDPPVALHDRGTPATEATEVDVVVIAPARPGHALAEAAERRLPVG